MRRLSVVDGVAGAGRAGDRDPIRGPPIAEWRTAATQRIEEHIHPAFTNRAQLHNDIGAAMTDKEAALLGVVLIESVTSTL